MRLVDYVERVRAARGAKNLSLTKFAAQIGMGRSTLVRIEQGVREPEYDEYVAMARVSGLPLAFFTAPDLGEALGQAGAEVGASEVSALREAIAELVAVTARHSQELSELQAWRRRQGPSASGG